MTQHTPAPWSSHWNKYYFEINSERDGLIGDACASQFIEGNTDKGKANAQLMAAAPEMLKALEEIIFLVENGHINISGIQSQYQKIRETVVKAKGES